MTGFTLESAISASMSGAGAAQADAERLAKSLIGSDEIALNKIMRESEQAAQQHEQEKKKRVQDGTRATFSSGKTVSAGVETPADKEAVDTLGMIQKFLDTPTALSLGDFSGIGSISKE